MDKITYGALKKIMKFFNGNDRFPCGEDIKIVEDWIEKVEMRCNRAFIVNSKDIFDKEKNPKLSLSPKEILKNKRIKKIKIK